MMDCRWKDAPLQEVDGKKIEKVEKLESKIFAFYFSNNELKIIKKKKNSRA
jgi:hypothetical protein